MQVVRLDSSLAEIASAPGLDPRRCLKEPILPRGISNLRVMDILNLFLEGVVEQLQKPDDASASGAAAAGGSAAIGAIATGTTATPCTAPSLASSSGRSSTRSSKSDHSASSTRPKAKPRATASARSASPPQPRRVPMGAGVAGVASGAPAGPAELRKLRQQAAQCQEFKEMSDQANHELVRIEGEVHELREQVSHLSRQNKQLLLQLRQQRLQHQQELRLCRNAAEASGEDVNLLTYLKEAPEQNDSQLEKDIESHSGDVRVCLQKALRHVLLEQFGQPLDFEDRTMIATPLDGVRTHVRQLWATLRCLWRSDSLLEDIVEEFFHSFTTRSTPEEPEWPEVADNAEKQALQMIERLSRDASSPSCDMRIKPYHVPEPPSAGSDASRLGMSTTGRGITAEAALSESPARNARRPRQSQLAGDAALNAVSAERLPTNPSYSSPLRLARTSRSPSPNDTRTRGVAPNMPAVLMAGPVLSRANGRLARSERQAQRPTRLQSPGGPEQSLSPRVPTKRSEVRPRSLSPEMAKRLQKSQVT